MWLVGWLCAVCICVGQVLAFLLLFPLSQKLPHIIVTHTPTRIKPTTIYTLSPFHTHQSQTHNTGAVSLLARTPGVKLSAADAAGSTPLHHAAAAGCTHAVEVLWPVTGVALDAGVAQVFFVFLGVCERALCAVLTCMLPLDVLACSPNSLT